MDTPNLDWLPFAATAVVFAAVFLVVAPLLELWDQFSRWYVSDLLPTLDALDLERVGLTGYLRGWGLAAVAIPFVIVILGAPLLALPVAAAVVAAPRIWLKHRITQRRAQIRGQLVPAMLALANTARAGMPLAAGIAVVAEELPDPLRAELRWIAANTRRGLPLATALENTKRRLQIEAFTLFAASVQSTLERGGRITELLDRLALSIREVERLERTLEASTAGGRRVIQILSVFPALFLAGFLFVFPEGTKLMFTTLLGHVLLVMILGLTAISVKWGKRILSFDP